MALASPPPGPSTGARARLPRVAAVITVAAVAHGRRVPALALALAALALAALLASPTPAAAAEPSSRSAAPAADAAAIPEPLRPWTSWVLAGQPTLPCTPTLGRPDERACAWPSRLSLLLDDRGGRFTQGFHLDARTLVPLPGDPKRWPQDVKVDGAPAPVVVTEKDGPALVLPPGDPVVTGTFGWDRLPESLAVPPETGLLSLSVRGEGVPRPRRDEAGVLFLQRAATEDSGERLDVVVHRKVTDAVPVLLTTRVALAVAGKSREVLFGRALPEGFVPVVLDSPLPARLEGDGRLRVQLRPGAWTLELTARSAAPVTRIVRPVPEGPWRDGDEVWVFEAHPEVRVATVEGLPAVDPAQTTLPEAWRKLPAYSVKEGEVFLLAEKRRGDADPAPDQLTLERTLWLDFDGAGYTVSDTLKGTLSRSTRLEMAAPMVLGRAAIFGADQVITHVDDPAVTGVEVRQGTVTVTADSRLVGDAAVLPAVGWKHDFRGVKGTLHLPPGWRLFHAAGVDDVPGTWLRHWSLFELFLALVTGLAVARLFGAPWGAVALVMLVLTFPEAGAPQWAWVAALAFEALVRALPAGGPQRFLRVMRAGALLVLLLVAVPFVIAHVREGLFPVLGQDGEVAARSAAAGATRSPAEAEPPADRRDELGADEEQEGPSEAAAAEDKEVAPAKKGTEAQKAPASAPAAPPQAQQLAPRRALKAPARSAPPAGYGSLGASQRQSATETYDPKAIVQTGPGLPRWQWTTLPLQWSGPVDAQQRIHFYFLSPAMNLVLALLRAALLVLVVVRLVPWPRRSPPGAGAARAGAAALGAWLFALPLAAGVALTPASAGAQSTPSKELLDELAQRLAEPPPCAPRCASAGRLAVEVRPRTVRARLEVDAAAAVAFPLPGDREGFTPDTVLVDGKPARALRRSPEGRLLVALTPGVHQILLEGAAPDAEAFQLALPERPHRVEVTAEGWTASGVHEDGLADDALRFVRAQKEDLGGGAPQKPGALPPFVRVERTLRLGLEWRVDTRVVRASPGGVAVAVEVPLLAGESVTTAEVRVKDGVAQVALGPQVDEVAWTSLLASASPLRLEAMAGLAAVEVWRLELGPMWHAAPTGIPPVHATVTAGPRVPEWRPWPSETLTLAVTRPDAVPGQSLTVDSVLYELAPGLRAVDGTLTLELRASRGLSHAVTLPAGAELQALSVDGKAQPVRQEGRTVSVPVAPGRERVTLQFRLARELASVFRSPALDIGAPAVNATVRVTNLSPRWILFTGGPRVGPVVLFWSLLVTLVVLAVGLSRVRAVPLAAWEWTLLFVGLSQVPVEAGAVVVGGLLLFGWRAAQPEVAGGHLGFNLRQVALVGVALAALGVLVFAVQAGLLGAPEMQLRGNGSSPASLAWYQDRTGPSLPEVWALSAPMLSYRGAMLIWALWIARAVLRWLRWGWSALVAGGGWRGPSRRPATPVGMGSPAPAGGGAPPAPPAPPADAAEDDLQGRGTLPFGPGTRSGDGGGDGNDEGPTGA